MSSTSDIVILGGARTPMGGMLGNLSSLSAPQLGAVAIRGTRVGGFLPRLLPLL